MIVFKGYDLIILIIVMNLDDFVDVISIDKVLIMIGEKFIKII